MQLPLASIQIPPKRRNVHQSLHMAASKELEALVISALSRMNDRAFRKVLKASLDGRRAPTEHEPVKRKKRKKLHWKTREKMERERKVKSKPTKKKAAAKQATSA